MSNLAAISGGWGAHYHLNPQAQICACRPPHVPVPKPGPCPKHKPGDVVKKAAKKAAAPKKAAVKKAAPKKAAKAAPKATPKKAPSKAAPKKAAKAVARKAGAPGAGSADASGYVAGRDLSDELDYRPLAELSQQGLGSDPGLAEIARRQGFDGLPQILDDAELQQLLDAGGVALWRGVEPSGGRSAGQIAHDFRAGPVYYGHGGAYGNGIYFGTGAEVSDNYSKGNLSGQIYAVLKPGSKIIDYEDAKANVAQQVHDANVHGNTLVKALNAATVTRRGRDPEQAYKAAYATYRAWNDNKDVRHTVLGDAGRLAATQGYDAIRITNTGRPYGPYYILLNRTAVATEGLPEPSPAPAGRTASAAVHADRVTAVLAHLAAVTGSPVQACLKPGEHHPGPCPTGRHRLLTRGTHHPRAAPHAAENGHQPAIGKDILSSLDMATIGKLPKRAGGDPGLWRSGQHDAQLAAIAARQGFDGPPNLVDASEFDRLRAAPGAIALYRGVANSQDLKFSGEQLAAQFRDGPIFYGQGRWGNGIYTSTDHDLANSYASSDRAINEMVLSPSARTTTRGQLLEQMRRDIPPDTAQRLAAVSAAQRMAFEPGTRSSEMIAKALDMTDTLKPQDWLWMDPSAYAMARGYDAFYRGEPDQYPHGEWVLLNRTAVSTLTPPLPPRSLHQIWYPDQNERVPAALASGGQPLPGQRYRHGWIAVQGLPDSLAARDPLGKWATLTDSEKKSFSGSARIGGPDQTGVNIVGDAEPGDPDHALIIDTGTLADHFGPSPANQFSGDYSIMRGGEVAQLRRALANASTAAAVGRPFSAVIDGEDAGDIRVQAAGNTADPRVAVVAYEWSRRPKSDLEILDDEGGYDPFPPPEREDYETEAEYRQAVREYPAALAQDEADWKTMVLDDYRQTHQLPPAAMLTPGELSQLSDALERLLAAEALPDVARLASGGLLTCCLEPGEHHPGPCPQNKGLIRKLLKRGGTHRPKAVAQVPAGHKRAAGKDILDNLDMATIGALSKRAGGSNAWQSGQHDLQLAAIAAQQGFDGPPNVVGQAEFDRLKAASGAIGLYRGAKHNEELGLTGDEIAAQFRTGPIFYGLGWSGNGIYSSTKRDEALNYTSEHDPRGLSEMVMSPVARTTTYPEVLKAMERDIPDDTRARLSAITAAQRQSFVPGQRAGDMIVEAQAWKSKLQPQDWLWMDPSAYAMARGYDAIYHGRHDRFPDGEWVLLNRTAVSALEPSTPPRTLQEIYPEDYPAVRVPVPAGADLKVRVYLGDREITHLTRTALSTRAAVPDVGHRFLTISGAQVAICGCRDTGKPGVCKGYKKGQAQTPPPSQPAPPPGTPPGYPPVLNQHVAKKTAAATPPGKKVKIPPRRKLGSGGSGGVKAPKVKLPKPTQPSKLAQSAQDVIECADCRKPAEYHSGPCVRRKLRLPNIPGPNAGKPDHLLQEDGPLRDPKVRLGPHR